ncbi:hypothetical protein PC9H_010435 [Pleurotus ostreatus]|uniref:Uncharacterized protein n=1 Tax=Pleurotus ostreatus TaxID=5322 RepID=A0A8H7DNM7_PLEOS|nr:uncharacterized protein PC9H_010435 [Pleurotus ostreatus]KAF7422279.1 hypothetical protein PC9H_010435 [Pleurotus ostreatus]
MPGLRRLMQDGPSEGFLDFTRCMLWDDIIHATVMRQLSLNALRWYSLTCKAIYGEVQIFYQRSYSLNPILEPFIPLEHIPAFRRLQGESGLVISGSAALQFFTRATYPESDLDLYVEYAHVFEVGKWLEWDVGCIALNHHGEPQPFYQTYFHWIASDAQHRRIPCQRPCYTALPGSRGNAVPGDLAHSTQGNYSFKGIRAVVSFLSPVHSRKIQLIICRRNVMEVILGFHSTVVMNLITVSHAYSLYGKETLERKISLPVDSARSDLAIGNLEAAKSKYVARGWTMIPTQAEALRRKAFEGWTARHVGDSKCWVVNLPVKRADLFKTTDPLRKNEWALLGYKFGMPMIMLQL